MIIKINTTPRTVMPTVFKDEFSLCASGRISETPIYNKNPAKNPKYNNNVFSDRVKNKVESPPRTGAIASIKRNCKALLSVFL